MKIRLLREFATARGLFPTGQELEWEEVDARRLVSLGYAELVRTDAVEQAVRRAPERAVRR